MYCRKCGNEIKDNVKFCNACGTAVRERRKEFDTEILTEENYNLTEDMNINNKDFQEDNKLKNKNRVIIATLIVLVLATSTLGTYIYLNKYSKNSSQTQKENVVTKKEDSNKTKENEDLPSSTIPANDLNDSNGKSTKNTNDNTKTSSDYVFSDSASRKLEDYELKNKSVEDLSLGRNEIFARHGYIFKEEPYKSYFANKTWYVPDSSFVANEENLNGYENYNVQMFLKYEKREF
ncbi:YARHG domain-containing protein [Clostridium sporogenes]|uniref:YARHG domain-containing protein n=1 Tax=unclassified Clostridium TaxID=2614128 RepID=UPI0013D75D3C|nr:YARHG domain-containing protein [Clostridium sporogenes]NFS25568.1 YARHG domain-containing protein [Clostridium sporogenes]